jgi:hypothetical protein
MLWTLLLMPLALNWRIFSERDCCLVGGICCEFEEEDGAEDGWVLAHQLKS